MLLSTDHARRARGDAYLLAADRAPRGEELHRNRGTLRRVGIDQRDARREERLRRAFGEIGLCGAARVGARGVLVRVGGAVTVGIGCRVVDGWIEPDREFPGGGQAVRVGVRPDIDAREERVRGPAQRWLNRIEHRRRRRRDAADHPDLAGRRHGQLRPGPVDVLRGQQRATVRAQNVHGGDRGSLPGAKAIHQRRESRVNTHHSLSLRSRPAGTVGQPQGPSAVLAPEVGFRGSDKHDVWVTGINSHAHGASGRYGDQLPPPA